MTYRKRDKAAMLMWCMDLRPPLIRDALLSDAALRRDYSLALDAVISFGAAKVSFKRSTLYAAVRAVGGGARAKPKKVTDQTGAKWEVSVRTTKETVDIVLASGTRILSASQFLLLTRMKGARIEFFKHESVRLNLPVAVARRWKKVLRQRPLGDDELDEVMTQVFRTPASMSSVITEHLAQGDISVEMLVPRSLGYYEQLVGRHAGQATIKEYVEEVAADHIHRLLTWRPIEGLQLALLMDAHPRVTETLAKEAMSAAELNKLALWAQGSDALARGSILALAIRRLRGHAILKTNVRALAERFSGQGGLDKYDQFGMLAATFVMVDGELAKTRIMSAKPAYWRRLAALAHASLINRCILSTPADLSKLIDWMRSARIREHLMRCYVDMRLEPRWIAEFAGPRQLKYEIAGRVLAAALNAQGSITKLGLGESLLGNASSSLKRQLKMPFANLPGPLEGNLDPVAQLEPTLLDQMRTDLAAARPALSVFARVANIALFCKLPEDIPRLLSEAIRRAQYRLDSEESVETFQSTLGGLATLAAVTRSHLLADELFILIRSYRHSLADKLDVDAAFRVGMIACASRVRLDEWCTCVGTLISDLGFGELHRDEASLLHALVGDLCDLVPELWSTCGRGLAAMEVVASS
jgi:hypothetical protein